MYGLLISLSALLASTLAFEIVERDTMLFYSHGWDANKVDAYQMENKGNWTKFLDADKPWGTGEFEDVWRERFHYMGDCRALWCRNPVAMEVGLADMVYQWKPNATLKEAWHCCNLETLTPETGFRCMNLEQRASRFKTRDPACRENICEKVGMKKSCSRCFNAKVRYFCLFDNAECQHGVFPYEI